MKYLIIAAVVSFVLAFIYLRVRPYLRMIRKVAQSFTAVTDATGTAAPARGGGPPADHPGRAHAVGGVAEERRLRENALGPVGVHSNDLPLGP